MTRSVAAAYRSGTAAHKRGKSRDANPYNQGTPEAFAWMCAWINAKLNASKDA